MPTIMRVAMRTCGRGTIVLLWGEQGRGRPQSRQYFTQFWEKMRRKWERHSTYKPSSKTIPPSALPRPPPLVLPRVGKSIAASPEAAAAAEDAQGPPSWQSLRRLMVQRGVPFVGFGFMDNVIMLISGDYIEMSIGVTMGISTMAAAALGNVIADVVGLNLGGLLEEFANKLGLPDPKLSRQQLDLTVSRVVGIAGSTMGIAFGCVLGMIPLAIMAISKGAEKVTRPEDVYVACAERLPQLLNCERVIVYEVDKDGTAVVAYHTRANARPNLPPVVTRQAVEPVLINREAVRFHTDLGLKPEGQDLGARPQQSLLRRLTIAIGAVREPHSRPEVIHSVLSMPVLNEDGTELRAIVVAVNKRGEGLGFSSADVQAMAGLCGQLTGSLTNLHRLPEEHMSLRENMELLKLYRNVHVRCVDDSTAPLTGYD